MRNFTICTANSRQAAVWPASRISFEELLGRLKTPYRTEETAEQYQNMTKPEKDVAKDKGGFMAGTLKGTRRKKNKVVSRSIVTLDGDKLTKDFIEEYGLIHQQYLSIIYTTHSHTPEKPRARFLIFLTRDVTVDEYNAVARLLAGELGIAMFDPVSFECNQLMYWPTCPSDGEYICESYDGELLDPDEFLAGYPYWKDPSTLPQTPGEKKQIETQKKKQEDPLSKEGIVGAYCRTHSVTWVMDHELSDIYAPSANADDRYDYIPGEGSCGVVVYDDRFVYSHHATDPAGGRLLNAFDLCRIHKFGDDDPKKSFQDMAEYASRDDDVKLLILQERQEAAQADFAGSDTDWKKQLEYEKRSTVLKNSLRNLKLILENDENLKNIVFNEQSDGMEIKGGVPWSHPSKYWRDADDAQLISYVEDNYGTFSDRNYKYAVGKVTDDRRYHPIREYLDSLPEWDGIPRVDTLLIDYFGAEDSRYVRAVTRKTLCGAVSRVLHPGIKFDTMLVLNGSQGIGKSTLIAKLGGEWFSDSLSLNDTKDTKTAAEKLQGYWILEIGELAGLRKAEEETLRGFITRQNDIYRAAFGRRATPHLRQCIFIGTTNAENGYLRDTTGNRRFWPVKTPGGGAKKSWDVTKEDVQQIWAETLVYVKKGERLYLLPDEEEMAAEEQRNAMESDEREGLVRDYLDTLLPDDWESMDIYRRREFLGGEDITAPKGTVKRDKVCTLEIWCECFCKDRAGLGRSDSNSLTAILIRMGWVRQPQKTRFGLYGPQYYFVPRESS